MQKGYTGFDKALKYLFQNANEVGFTPILESGTPIGTLEIDGVPITVYAPAGGSASVSYTPIQTEGTQIGTLTINGTNHPVYVPEIEATPDYSTGTKIGTVTIDGDDFDFYIPTGVYATSAELSNAVATLQANFQAGVDAIYNACVGKGSTPASHSLADVVDAIYAIGGNTPHANITSSNTIPIEFSSSVTEGNT